MTAHQPSTKQRDIHAEITASIEQGPGKLQLPWRRSSGPLFMPVNARTEKAYNGINIVSLCGRRIGTCSAARGMADR